MLCYFEYYDVKYCVLCSAYYELYHGRQKKDVKTRKKLLPQCLPFSSAFVLSAIESSDTIWTRCLFEKAAEINSVSKNIWVGKLDQFKERISSGARNNPPSIYGSDPERN